MKNNWHVSESTAMESIQRLSKELNIPAFLAQSLVLRGVKSFSDARAFFRPSLKDSHSPFLMLNMEKACERLIQNLNRKILIYGDYDVDGTTAVSMSLRYLKKHCANLHYYIPDRYSEGYGISNKAVNYVIEEKFDLMIALDCGISAIEQAATLKKNNIELIICDHHLPGTEVPDAIVLNPKQKNCNYPYKDLSGCGVAYKLLEALLERGVGEEADLQDLHDLLCVSIAADMVPITGENRIYASAGLQKLENSKNEGLLLLMDSCKIQKPYQMQHISFGIGPRINAAGRMDHAAKVVELFSGTHPNSKDLVLSINADNESRKSTEEETCKEALAQTLSKENAFKHSNVVHHPLWVKGVIGIVATKLQQHKYVPTVVLTQNGDSDFYTGSARSVGEINLYQALNKCSAVLEKFGGHAAAAGLTIHKDNIAAFKTLFDQAIQELSMENDFIPHIHLDAQINLNKITPKVVSILQQMEPCGIDNPTPQFVACDLKARNVNVIGSKHLKFDCYQVEEAKIKHSVVFFNAVDHYYQLLNKKFDLCFTLGFNEWNGKKTIQLMAKDINFY